jgi:hypothetical protein
MRILLLALALVTSALGLWTMGADVFALPDMSQDKSARGAPEATDLDAISRRLWRDALASISPLDVHTVYSLQPFASDPARAEVLVHHWLLSSPTRSDLWILLAALRGQQRTCVKHCADILQMAYLAGTGKKEDWLPRIAVATSDAALDEPTLRTFLKFDLTAGLRNIDGAEERLKRFLDATSDPNRRSLLALLTEVEPDRASRLSASK